MKPLRAELKAILIKNTSSDGQGYGHDIEASLNELEALIAKRVDKAWKEGYEEGKVHD